MASSIRQYNTINNPGQDGGKIPSSVPTGNHLNGHDDEVRAPLLGSAPDSSSPLPVDPLLERERSCSFPSWLQTVREEGEEFWLQSKGIFLVMFAQFFGASMNIMTQILELNSGLDPFQILFARMSVTVIASYAYMLITKVRHPFGTRPVLHLLILRATGGFLGVYCLYFSVKYLPLSEATVLTFLAPILTCYACSLLIPNETFTRKQQLAGLVSLVGVVLIARPFSRSEPSGPLPDPGELESNRPGSTDEFHHFLAIFVALLGVLGASCAYTTIRIIGQRCHPLVSVTYFSSLTTIISLLAMAFIPSVPFKLPETGLEWSLIAGLGICGFLLQFLLTAGLSYVPPPRQLSGNDDRSDCKQSTSSSGSRATSMVYTQMLFALFYDKTVWGNTLSAMSWVGSSLIVGSALYVALVRDGQSKKAKAVAAEEEN